MANSFSIREYTVKMRDADVPKCWPFDGEQEILSLPSMDVRKFRYWTDDLDQSVRSPARSKQRGPKKRSISELFASAPQIGTVQNKSDGCDRSGDGERGDEAAPIKRMKEQASLREKKKKKLEKKKMKKLEICDARKDKADDVNTSSPVDASNGVTDPEPGNQQLETPERNIESEAPKLADELHEVSLPLNSILRKRKRSPLSKKGKSVTFSVTEDLTPNEKQDLSLEERVPTEANKGKNILSIDLNQALPEPIDLNLSEMNGPDCIENLASGYNRVSSDVSTLPSLSETDVTRLVAPDPGFHSNSIYTGEQIIGLPLNSKGEFVKFPPDFNIPRNHELGLDCNTCQCTGHDKSRICNHSDNGSQPGMLQTVRLMGKNVTISTEFKAPNFGKDQPVWTDKETVTGSNNNLPRDILNYPQHFELQPQFKLPNNGFELDSTGLPNNFITPMISFPIIPNNFKFPQFPMVSPPMISFPLGFPHPYGLAFTDHKARSKHRSEESSSGSKLETPTCESTTTEIGPHSGLLLKTGTQNSENYSSKHVHSNMNC